MKDEENITIEITGHNSQKVEAARVSTDECPHSVWLAHAAERLSASARRETPTPATTQMGLRTSAQ